MLQVFFAPAIGHYVPLTHFFTYVYFQVVKINPFGYALESIASHLLIIFLIYKLSTRFFSSKLHPLLIAGYFAFNASSHQATSWLVADINTHFSTIFALLSMISLFNYRKIWVSLVFLIIALLFKETPIGLFLILPLGIYLFNADSKVRKFLDVIKVLIVGLSYFLFRVSMVFFHQISATDKIVTKSQSIYEILVNLFTFPTKILAQLFLPTRLLLSLARSFAQILPQILTGVQGTTAFDKFVEGTALQIIYWVIFIAMLAGVYILVNKIRDMESKKAIIFGLSFLFVNSLIYILSPGRPGNIPDVDSRNLYFPLIGVSIFIISFFRLLFKQKTTVLLVVSVCLTTIHVIWLSSEFNTLTKAGQEQKTILEQVKRENPVLPPKTIFYMESDKPFYGMADNQKIFPFQMNLGFVLIVWYWPTEKFPKSFGDQTKFLYGLTEEGYREDGDRGIGYFRDFQSLQTAVSKYDLPRECVIAYHYNSETKKTTNITKVIRNKLK